MRSDAIAAAQETSQIEGPLALGRAIDRDQRSRGRRPSALAHSILQASRLSLATALVLVIAIAPVTSAIAGTLEIPQAVPSGAQSSEPPGSASSTNSSPEIPSGSAADYAAQAAPTSTAQTPPMPQVAGIDQYMNQDQRGSGYPPGSSPDPRNNRPSLGGALLLGGLIVGLVALDLATKHH